VALDRVVLLGAGGAGAAVAHALLSLGAGAVDVFDVDPDRAERLANPRVRARTLDSLADVLGKADGLVHATPTGMAGHPGLPFPAEFLRPELWVADIVYRPLETALLRAARERGCVVLDGGRMAVFQAVDSFRLITGREPDQDRMLRRFAELAERTSTP
jgi:shikimate dehydrogenase